MSGTSFYLIVTFGWLVCFPSGCRGTETQLKDKGSSPSEPAASVGGLVTQSESRPRKKPIVPG